MSPRRYLSSSLKEGKGQLSGDVGETKPGRGGGKCKGPEERTGLNQEPGWLEETGCGGRQG